MDHKDGNEDDQAPFGAQLIAAIRKERLPLSGFSYTMLQEIRAADREETIRILRRESPYVEYGAIQALRHEAPETIASRLAQGQRQRAMTMLVLLAMMT